MIRYMDVFFMCIRYKVIYNNAYIYDIHLCVLYTISMY
jgi:hypothetical protein